MARCFWILRISLGEMYHRLRRASLRIRSCITSFLNLLSRFSCDSPSRRLTVANPLTSFLPPDTLGRPSVPDIKTRPAHHALDSSRALTTLAVELSPMPDLKTLVLYLSSRRGCGVTGIRQSTWPLLSLAGPPWRPQTFASLRPPPIQVQMLLHYTRFLALRQSWRLC